MLDLVGVSALNVDLIATRSNLLRVDPKIIAELRDRFEHGTEQPTTEEEVNYIVKRMGHCFSHFLGGSAFNVIQTFCALNRDFHIGYVGVIGKSPSNEVDFSTWFNKNDVDQTFLARMEEQQGICISYIDAGERHLRTYPGVNVRFPDFAESKKDSIIKYLCNTRIIHVTSLFDPKSPPLLVEIIKEVKSCNPWTKISFDPGHHWVCDRNEFVQQIYKYADYIFLNYREFRELGNYRFSESDKETAKNIIDRYAPASTIILLKRFDSIRVFYKLGVRLIELIHRNAILPVDEIEDATGAGDVFAGGFLAGQLVHGFELRDSIELGLRLVHSKLQSAGTSKFYSFPRIFNSFVDEICARSNGQNETVSRAQEGPEVSHSPDFRSLSIKGESFSFTPRQAKIVEILWNAWEKGTPEISQQYILEEAEIMSQRLDTLFKGNEAFGRIIVKGKTKGSYKLVL